MSFAIHFKLQLEEGVKGLPPTSKLRVTMVFINGLWLQLYLKTIHQLLICRGECPSPIDSQTENIFKKFFYVALSCKDHVLL